MDINKLETILVEVVHIWLPFWGPTFLSVQNAWGLLCVDDESPPTAARLSDDVTVHVRPVPQQEGQVKQQGKEK